MLQHFVTQDQERKLLPNYLSWEGGSDIKRAEALIGNFEKSPEEELRSCFLGLAFNACNGNQF